MSDIDAFLEEAFERNFERLRGDTGRSLGAQAKEAARQQVWLYWKKLSALAEAVTETEVRLTLPEQVSPAGRRFTLEGIVDIVREEGRTTMYDIKTYLDADAIRDDDEQPHYRQLSLYSHIWQTLRGHALDEVAVVATRPPPALEAALMAGDDRRIDAALAAWEPIVPVPVTKTDVAETVAAFGAVVDRIETHDFTPPAPDILLAPTRPRGRKRFGAEVCGNCDVRFSCGSFRHFTARSRPSAATRAFGESLEDFGSEDDKNQWRDATLKPADKPGKWR